MTSLQNLRQPNFTLLLSQRKKKRRYCCCSCIFVACILQVWWIKKWHDQKRVAWGRKKKFFFLPKEPHPNRVNLVSTETQNHGLGWCGGSGETSQIQLLRWSVLHSFQGGFPRTTYKYLDRQRRFVVLFFSTSPPSIQLIIMEKNDSSTHQIERFDSHISTPPHLEDLTPEQLAIQKRLVRKLDLRLMLWA